MQKISIKFARLAIFIIYFWFGLLKLIGESPASPMVKALFSQTTAKILPSLDFNQFMIAFAIFEMLIGILFLIPKFNKIAFFLLAIHIITTTLPLFMVPEMVWTKPFVPTLEGQYIIKNLAVIGLALHVWSSKK
ncbi:MAG: hypothetical protein AAB863_00145 [Patescibacteria group bacterium]